MKHQAWLLFDEESNASVPALSVALLTLVSIVPIVEHVVSVPVVSFTLSPITPTPVASSTVTVNVTPISFTTSVVASSLEKVVSVPVAQITLSAVRPELILYPVTLTFSAIAPTPVGGGTSHTVSFADIIIATDSLKGQKPHFADIIEATDTFKAQIPKIGDIITATQEFKTQIKVAQFSDIITVIQSFKAARVIDLGDVIEATDAFSSVGSVIADAELLSHIIEATDIFNVGFSKTVPIQQTVRANDGFIVSVHGLTVGGKTYTTSRVWPNGAPLTYGTNVTLEFPNTSPTHILLLRNPKLGNAEELNLTRILRETRGLTLEVFSANYWPKSQTLRWQFEGLTLGTRSAFMVFLNASLGKKIRITDYEGRQWDGVIINPNAAIIENLPMCGHSIEFDFRGNLV